MLLALHRVTAAQTAEVGVAIVPSVADYYVITMPLLLAAIFMLIFAGKSLFEERYARVVVFGVLFALSAGTLVTYFVRNKEEIQKVHDYPATVAALEARYGVTLDDAVVAELWFPGPGKYGTVDQDEIGSVTRTDGTVIEDVYVQFSTGDNQRVALVRPEDGTNTLLVTKGGWWPELPVVG